MIGSVRKILTPAAEARKRFPGADPRQACLREAFVAIALARRYSATAATHLGELSNIARLDPEELADSLVAGGTIVEYGLSEAAVELVEALRGCRLAAAALRRTRRRRQKSPRKLEIVS